jgi:hypothetical protein
MPRLLLVVVAWSLAACDLGRSKPDDGLVLRTYEVPSGRERTPPMEFVV